jgi:hypothetical protein
MPRGVSHQAEKPVAGRGGSVLKLNGAPPRNWAVVVVCDQPSDGAHPTTVATTTDQCHRTYPSRMNPQRRYAGYATALLTKSLPFKLEKATRVETRKGPVRLILASIVLVVLLCWNSAFSSQWLVLDSNFFAFHEEKFAGLTVKIEDPITSDAEILVELVGIPNVAKANALHIRIRRAFGLNNAASGEGEGYQTILYDPSWAAGDTAGFYLALGHEAGHLFCGHTVGVGNSDRAQKELEADQFGGASIRRFEVYHNQNLFAAIFAAAAAKYPEQASGSYPLRALRLEALKRGYEQGSQCGGLEPVQQSGYRRLSPSGGPVGPCRPVRTGPTSYACEH